MDDEDDGIASYQGHKLIVLEVELVVNFYFGFY